MKHTAFSIIITTSLACRAFAIVPTAFETHCFKCHDATQAEGELDLESFVAKQHDASTVRGLEELLSRLKEHDMPPKKSKKQPSEAERADMLAWADGQLDALAQASRDDPGVVIMPRLTRNEYRNVIRDLSGGVVTKAGEYLPNEGGAGEGFANVGAAQGMSAAQFEKYLEAAKGALRHLRVSPHDGLVWSAVPHQPVDEPKAAIVEATDDIIAWHFLQQQKWGAEHRDVLSLKYQSAHAVYLEAVWRATHGRPPIDVPLAPVALEKWTRILNDTTSKTPLADWAAAWRAIPENVSDAKLRAQCVAIVGGKLGAASMENKGDFAPPYEISFHEAKDEVLWSAKMEGRWPFRIEIGEAKELFLVLTDAGDGGDGEFGLWHKGRFIFKDGTSKPWQEAVKIVGANSGRDFPWGLDGANEAKLEADAVGQKPPGVLKLAVPENAIVFEVDFTLDKNRTKLASVQALVLKEKPSSQSYVAGRFVFGGRNTKTVAKTDPNKERDQLLRKRNVSEANETKLGLNAERNLFADWTRTSIEVIGGPWPEHTAEKAEPNAPYFYTVAEVRRNATPEDLDQLRLLGDRLVALAKPPAAGALEAKACGWLDTFAARAWRRPLNGDDQSKLMQLYRAAAAQGVSFDSALKVPLLVVLMSPEFLYRGSVASRRNDEKTSPSSSPHPIVSLSSQELASRLSFFLWASIPDDELLHLAREDKLRDPAVLKKQAARMQKDPRAASLANDFAAQLWHFSDFETFTGPDEKRFKEFTPSLRQAMLDEVTMFIGDLIRNDAPLTNLLDADYTFANLELANHYGMTVPGNQSGTSRVALTDNRRGGLVTMGLFLTKTSVPLRTSPVQRGNWVNETFLGRRIKPPPVNVGQISADEKSPDGLNIQQQLARHRADASCAACHVKLDPPGIALENFDPIGRWRDTERDGSPITSTDSLRDGTKLEGVAGLKRYLRSREDEFFTNFNRKLLGYALGRAVLPGDKMLLERMKLSGSDDGPHFSRLVEAIVTSPQFTRKRSSVEPDETQEPKK
ncbi:hypothetical protein BH11VER1_BH11VER1_07720 [soil metagenome]